jgi:hypothetical protein
LPSFPLLPLVSLPSFPFWATTVPDEKEDAAAGLAEGEVLAVAFAEGEGEGLDEGFTSSPPQEVNPIASAPAITQEAGIRIIHSPQNFSPRYPLFQEMTQFLKELEVFFDVFRKVTVDTNGRIADLTNFRSLQARL